MKNPLLLLAIFTLSIGFSQEKLDEVKVKNSKKGLQKALKKTTNTTIVSSKELLKAACCNLAESFETNPAIDVHFADALTGTKQIKMLGLTSPYLLFTEENIPSIRGASQVYGLSFVPGTWVESIQITKGAGSVTNGFESISGQINTELIKPSKEVPLFVNFYGDTGSRYELNTHLTKKLSDKWATSLLVHGNTRVSKNDMNHDHFLDNPLAKQVNLSNRWEYSNTESGWVSFFNFKLMKDDKLAGDLDFDKSRDKGTTNKWGSEINTTRFDFSSKTGYIFEDRPFQSLGFQNAFSYHNQESYFGLRTYDIAQKSIYSTLLFSSIINNTYHKYTTGISFTNDEYNEFFNKEDVSRIDTNIGAFFEYSFDNNEKVSFVAGARADHHNRLGTFFTPRLHVKYAPWEKTIIKMSAGRGKRAANIFAENQQFLGSSRQFNITSHGGAVYGLDPEIAWNYGVSINQSFTIFDKKADLTLDLYRTNFQNQVVVDVMQGTQEVLFYNLKNKSYANSLQLDLNYEIIKHLNLRSSYKYFDVVTDYKSGQFQKPLQAKHRFFTNLEFETHIKDKGQQWKFDATYNWLGKQQLPNTSNNPVYEQMPHHSPEFATLNLQITRTFNKNFEVYLGGENITNYTQERAILGTHNPFGTHFDTSINYAPIFGQMYYAGLRFKIRENK